MNKKTIFGWILKAPLILLILASCGASWYLAVTKQMSIGIATPILLTLILVAFIFGDYILSKEEN